MHPSDPIAAELPWLRTLARRLAAPADADDLVQDAWLDARRGPPQPQGPLRPWLSRVVRNRDRMQRRSAARRRGRESVAGSAAHGHGPPGPDVVELLETVSALLSVLEERDRTLLRQRYFEDRSPSELAALHGMTATAVRSRLHRSIARLRDELDERHAGDRGRWSIIAGAIPGAPHASAGKVTMATATGWKIGAGAVAAAVVVLGVWQTRAGEPDVEETAAAVASPTHAVSEARVESSAAPTTKAEQRKRWVAKRDRIVAAQQAKLRRLLTATADTDEPPEGSAPAMRPGPNPEDIPEDLDEALKTVVLQVRDALMDCVEPAMDRDVGELSLQASVIGEPDIGGIVESVDVTHDSLGVDGVRECLSESIYGIEFEPPDAGVQAQYVFTLDMATHEFRLGRPVPVEALDPGVNPAE